MAEPSPIPLSYAQERLNEWLQALDAASTGSSYAIDGQTVTRQDIPQIRAEIQRWHNTVNTIRKREKGQRRAMGAQVVFPTPGSGAGGIIPDDLWTDYRT